MKLIKNKITLTSLSLILFLVCINYVVSAKKNVDLNLRAQTNQEKSSLKEQSPPDIKKGFIQLRQANGNDRFVPLITGEIFSTIILTAMYGAVFLLVVTLVLGYHASKNMGNDNKNQYLSEALPNAIEGITIVYIVIVVLLFGILGITSAEGNLSILSAISGYVLGKGQGKRSSGETLTTPDNKPDKTISETSANQD
jgi:ABC-type phosphate/phosphonate transport system permease subunit